MEVVKNESQKQLVFHQTYLKALLENKNNTAHWTNYKEKYEEVIKNLNFYNEKHKHSICIPLGSKAFVRGQLVHTNDVRVTLGCGYFLKTSTKKAVEICERRIKVADELLEKWNKESKLMESMREYSLNKDAFGRGGSEEIIEPYDETEEQKWREKHREKEKKFREQLKEIKNKTEIVSIKDEKDLWEHLEALELQEELEDELNRLGVDDSSSEEELESDDDPGDEEMESETSYSYSVEVDNSSGATVVRKSSLKDSDLTKNNEAKQKKKRVSFAELPDIVPPPETGNDEVISFEIVKKCPEMNEEKKLDEDPVKDEVIEKVMTSDPVSKENEEKRPISQFKLSRKK